MIKDRLSTDNRKIDLEFEVGDQVYLKISPMKGVMKFCKKWKLSLMYIGPYDILQRVVNVSYELKLPYDMASVHPVFHFSIHKKCRGNQTSIIPLERLGVHENLSYEEILVEILDRQVKRMRNKKVSTVKVFVGTTLLR